MAEVGTAQSAGMEDDSAGDVTMYSDPMDISYTPPANHQPGMDLNHQNPPNSYRPPSPPLLGLSSSRRVLNPIATRIGGSSAVQTSSTSFRPLARFSPKSRANYAASIGSRNLLPVNRKYSNAPNKNTGFVGFNNNSWAHSDRYLSSNKPVAHSGFLLTTREGPFGGNSTHARKPLEGIGRSKSQSQSRSLFSTSTIQSSLPRKRSFDEGIGDDETNNTTPEFDSHIRSKYRLSQDAEGLTKLLHGGSEQVLPENNETVHGEPGSQTDPNRTITAPTTSSKNALSFAQLEPTYPRLSHFGSYVPPQPSKPVSQVLEAAPKETQATPAAHIPGSWPQISPLKFPDHIREGFSISSADSHLADGQISLMSGALIATPRPITNRPLRSTSPSVPQVYALDTQDPQMQGMEAVQDGPSVNFFWRNQWVPWVDRIQNIYNGPHGLKQTVASVVRAAVEVGDSVKRRAIGLFERYRPARRSTSTTNATNASPTRANIRALPEDTRQRVESRKWHKQRGRSGIENLPFPELSFDIPQFPSVTSSSHAEPTRTELSKATKKKYSQKTPGKSAKEKRHKKSKSGLQKQPSGQQPSPNLQRRLLLKSKGIPERIRLNRAYIQARRSKNLADTQIKSQTKQDIPPQPELVVSESPKFVSPPHAVSKVTKEQHPLGPVSESKVTSAPNLITEVAPHLQPSSPAVPKDIPPSIVSTDEQKENVPPKATVEIETVEPEPKPEPVVDPWCQLQPDFPLGRSVSAVSLLSKKPLPPGRTESIFASEWREIEEEQKLNERPARVRPEGPAVRPLPAKWATRVSDAMSLPNNRQVATTLAGDPLTKKDLATCYTPRAWLNDEVINSYLALIVDYLRRSNGNAGRHDKPKYHAFNTFFFSNLRDKGYQSVRRWASRAKIGGDALLNVETVFIPVHNSAHWTLMVVKPSEKTIENFDSLGSVSRRHVAFVKDWLRGELGPRFVEEEWTVLPSVSPQQDNGSDCGAFLLSTAKAVAIGLEPLSYGAKDIVLLRRKIVAEILNGGLEGDFEPFREAEGVLL